MKRYLEPVDLMVAIGLVATVAGASFVFMASNGALKAPAQPATSEMAVAATGPMAAMEWVQPALGQAILENDLIDRAMIADTLAAVKELNRATLMATRPMKPSARMDEIRTQAAAMDADHDARVQYVLGRAIVNHTGRGIRTGTLTAGQYGGAYTRQMIDGVQSMGHRLRQAYAEAREPLLGQTIIASTRETLDLAAHIQHRVGTAVARVTSMQERYHETKGEAQTQLALVTVASLHTEQMGDRFEKLVSADQSFGTGPVFFSEPRTWPDISTGVLMAAAVGLVALFFAGLLMPTAEPEAPVMARTPAPEYRKTA